MISVKYNLPFQSTSQHLNTVLGGQFSIEEYISKKTYPTRKVALVVHTTHVGVNHKWILNGHISALEKCAHICWISSALSNQRILVQFLATPRTNDVVIEIKRVIKSNK